MTTYAAAPAPPPPSTDFPASTRREGLKNHLGCCELELGFHRYALPTLSAPLPQHTLSLDRQPGLESSGVGGGRWCSVQGEAALQRCDEVPFLLPPQVQSPRRRRLCELECTAQELQTIAQVLIGPPLPPWRPSQPTSTPNPGLCHTNVSTSPCFYGDLGHVVLSFAPAIPPTSTGAHLVAAAASKGHAN